MGGFVNQLTAPVGVKLFPGGPYADAGLGDQALASIDQARELLSGHGYIANPDTEKIALAAMHAKQRLAKMNGYTPDEVQAMHDSIDRAMHSDLFNSEWNARKSNADLLMQKAGVQQNIGAQKEAEYQSNVDFGRGLAMMGLGAGYPNLFAVRGSGAPIGGAGNGTGGTGGYGGGYGPGGYGGYSPGGTSRGYNPILERLFPTVNPALAKKN